MQKPVRGRMKVVTHLPEVIYKRFAGYVAKAKKRKRETLDPVNIGVMISKAVVEYMDRHPIK